MLYMFKHMVILLVYVAQLWMMIQCSIKCLCKYSHIDRFYMLKVLYSDIWPSSYLLLLRLGCHCSFWCNKKVNYNFCDIVHIIFWGIYIIYIRIYSPRNACTPEVTVGNTTAIATVFYIKDNINNWSTAFSIGAAYDCMDGKK